MQFEVMHCGGKEVIDKNEDKVIAKLFVGYVQLFSEKTGTSSEGNTLIAYTMQNGVIELFNNVRKGAH